MIRLVSFSGESDDALKNDQNGDVRDEPSARGSVFIRLKRASVQQCFK